ncbi:UNVERIFIED_CONTAM: Metastasis suppressor protein 1 [Trichonephila clavipes]
MMALKKIYVLEIFICVVFKAIVPTAKLLFKIIHFTLVFNFSNIFWCIGGPLSASTARETRRLEESGLSNGQRSCQSWSIIMYISKNLILHNISEYKRVRQDIKKKSSDTLRLQKKVRKTPKGDAKKTLDSAIRDVNNKYHLLEETEKQALRRALIEERSRYCLFVNCLRPVIASYFFAFDCL